ncbi:MAG TPA: hypothetical protein VFA65_11040 [Bryobacteraceae bacterium]|nr:hypothetical protein [Bryobacteraceae bacterium]
MVINSMLDHVIHWLDIAGTAVDALLVVRVLQLRLYRIYLFITLACVLSVFFDAVQLWLGINSDENQRVFIYSRFLYAFLYPVVAWDAFEEIKDQVSKLRRLAIGRLISGLFFAALFGFIVTLFISADQEQPALSATLAIILWAGSCTASLAFLWSLQRALKAQQITRPNNTFVWMTFYQLTLIAEIAACFGGVVTSFLNATAQGVLNICLLTYGILITAWCVTKLKRLPSDVSTTANADLS